MSVWKRKERMQLCKRLRGWGGKQEGRMSHQAGGQINQSLPQGRVLVNLKMPGCGTPVLEDPSVPGPN